MKYSLNGFETKTVKLDDGKSIKKETLNKYFDFIWESEEYNNSEVNISSIERMLKEEFNLGARSNSIAIAVYDML